MTAAPPAVMVTLALSLLAAPLAAEAQPMRTFYRVGLLTPGGGSTERSASFDAFRQSLRESGYAEGRNLVIEYRYATMPGLARSAGHSHT